MSDPPVVDLFVEDHAQEEFLKFLLQRLADERGKQLDVRVRSARGGHGKALTEFEKYQKASAKGFAGLTMPHFVVVGRDSNCSRPNDARKAIHENTEPAFQHRVLVACPDPHVERWYLADPQTFAEVVGSPPKLGKRKCEHELYKKLLSKAVRDAGHPPTLGGIEFARELVQQMDLYRAAKNESTLGQFVKEASSRIQALQS